MRFRLTLLIYSLLLTLTAQAQKLTIEGMQATNDLSASQYRRADRNNEPCGLVKVRLATTGATFEGNVIPPVEYQTGEYWVYMTKGSKELHVKHPNFLPIEVHFADYGIRGIQPLTTYTVTLVMPQAAFSLVQTVQAPSSEPNAPTATHGKYNSVETFTVKGVSFKMIRIDGGTFMMGTSDDQGSNTDENSAHQETISSFYMGETEVTQKLWEAVMGNNPSGYKGDKHPVESISWDECHEFIEELNKLTGKQFRLPTEAEWEYAARGGNKSHGYRYSGSNKIDDVAWYRKNTKESGPRNVKTKRANELGLYDMSGNVWEWCQDLMPSPVKSINDDFRTYRGGGWKSGLEACRPPLGYMGRTPSSRENTIGMRLAL